MQVEAKNELESYAYSLKHQLSDKGKLAGKLSESEKSTVDKAVEQAIKWLDSNKEASTEDLKEQKKSLEEVVQPIISKLYQQAGAPPTGESEDSSKDEL